MLTKKSAALSTGALALAMMTVASPALASGPFKFHPAPNTFHLTGVLELQQSITIECDVKIDVSVDANGHASVTGRTFSNTSPGTSPLCGGVVLPFGVWTLNADSTTQVTAEVGSSSILGQCFGDIVGTWSNATSTLTFNSATVPGTPGDCTVDGTLTSDDLNVEIK